MSSPTGASGGEGRRRRIPGDGHDGIEGLESGEDLIDLRAHAAVGDLGDVGVSENANDAVVSVGTDTIALFGVAGDALGAGDFLI